MRTVHQNAVRVFMMNAGQTCPKVPTIPDYGTRELRARLILEEALETIQALGFSVVVTEEHDFSQELVSRVMVDNTLTKNNHQLKPSGPPNLVQIADGCANLSVVTIGTLVSCGIQDRELLAEVDRSNLLKFATPSCPKCSNPITIRVPETGEYRCAVCNHVQPKTCGGYTDDYRRWIKPPYYDPPNITQVLFDQGWVFGKDGGL